VDADAVEIRVLGCLIEKQRTTPDAYPLSLNALRTACNQATNRDPVVSYDDAAIRGALERLARKRWARLASGAGSRAVKYRHLLDEALGLDPAELALLCVLMLRGPQTMGELKQRTERLRRFDSLAEIEETLAALVEKDVVARLARRPGQKEERIVQLLGGESGAMPPARPEAEVASSPAELGSSPAADDPHPRLAALEERVRLLEAEVAELRRLLS
jgi:uncharacterized protein YceH (UPF0502 family)